MRILVVTRRQKEIFPFADTLAKSTEAELSFANNVADAIASAKYMPPAFMVLDENLDEGSPLELAVRLMAINAMINVAVISPLESVAFHEASEGLGILASVPPNPAASDGEALGAVFKKFL